MSQAYTDLVPPRWPNNVGKVRSIRSIDGKAIQFTIIDEILRPETDFPQKLICFQRVKMEPGDVTLRLGYYMQAWKESRRGMWIWGQYSPFLDQRDFGWIIEEAKSRGWFE